MLIRFANQAGQLLAPSGSSLRFSLPGNPFFPDYYYRLSNLYTGPSINGQYSLGVLVGQIVASEQEQDIYYDFGTEFIVNFSYPEGNWPFLKIYYGIVLPPDPMDEMNSTLVVAGEPLPFPNLVPDGSGAMIGTFYIDIVVDKALMQDHRPDWTTSENKWIYHGFISSIFRFVLLNNSIEIARSPHLVVDYKVPSPHEHGFGLFFVARGEPVEVVSGGGGDGSPGGGGGGGSWSVIGGTGQSSGSLSSSADTFPPCESPPSPTPVDPLEAQLVSFSFEHSDGGYNWSVTYTYENASSSVVTTLDSLRGLGRNAVGTGINMTSITNFLPQSLAGELLVLAGFPAGYVEYEETRAYDVVEGITSVREFTISGGLSTGDLLERRLTYIPNIRPFDPAGLAINASEEGQICLEDYLAIRRSSNDRPTLAEVFAAIEGAGVAKFYVSAPTSGRIPYADVPPKEDAETFDGVASVGEILSDLAPWMPYRAFIHPSSGSIRLAILDGTMSAGSFDIGSRQYIRLTEVVASPRPLREIVVATGPVPDIFDGVIEEDPPPDEPPLDEDRGSEECTSRNCVYYTYDVGPGVTTITKIIKECNRTISEERTTYAEVVIRPEGVGDSSVYGYCTRVAITRELVTYEYVSEGCDLVARRVRTVSYEPAILTDVPGWLFQPTSGTTSSLYALCQQLGAYLTAEREETIYEYDSKGCLRKETSIGYRLKDMAVDFDAVTYGINGTPILPPPRYSFEPIYSQTVYIHYGEGEWLASERALSASTSTVWGVLGGGFNPVIAMALANRPFYGRTTITNEAPPCRECGSDRDSASEDEKEAPCKLGSVSSASYGLTTKEFEFPYGAEGDVESISVPEVNLYWPIWTEELERIARKSGALGMSSSSSSDDPCTGPLRRDSTIIKSTIEGNFTDLAKPDAGAISSALQSEAQVYANYVERLREFGNRRIRLDFTGTTPDVFALAGLGTSIDGVGYIAMRTSLRLSIDHVASSLLKRRYDVSMELWEKVSL